MASIARSINLENESQIETIKDFFSSPEAETIIRQIYSSYLVDNDDVHTIESIRCEFRAYLSLHINLDEESINQFASDLFDDLLQSCDKALSIAIEKGILAAHEAKSVVRNRIVMDELTNIKRTLEFLHTATKPSIDEILKFEKRYRDQIADRHKDIKPPYFESVKRIPIDNIYVLPDFIASMEGKEQSDRIVARNFLENMSRSIILGNPGGGKSTFAQKICFDLSTKYSQRLVSNRELTPILIILRDYGANKKEQQHSILQFIESTSNSHYQLKPPSGAIEYLLLNGRAFVIFDGLDELLDTSYRQEISSDIESFCNLYPAVPVMVTSREVGYDQAPLDERKFKTLRLAPFDMDQIKEYVTKWFSLDEELTASQRNKKVASFLKESDVVPDLRSNPLILSLICNIYRGENYIPKNRPDVYEKCTMMLFDRWDKIRGISSELPFEEHIKPTMMHLAHWIYINEKLQGGVTEQGLINEATGYLYPRRFDNIESAQKASEEFIKLCRGRAWVFTDTGTREDGERLYQFTHRTFLEYFTAYYLVRNKETTEELIEFLIPKIENQEWDVVGQLAFQIKNKNTENAADRMFLKLLEKDDIGHFQKWNLVYFAVRCLEFIVPSPDIIRQITKSIIDFCFDWYPVHINDSVQEDQKNKVISSLDPNLMLGYLLHSSKENIKSIIDSIEKEISERIDAYTDMQLILAIELGLALEIPYIFGLDPIGRRREFSNLIVNLSKRIYAKYSDKIKSIYPKNYKICYLGFKTFRDIEIEDLISWHGANSLFISPNYYLFPSVYSSSCYELLMYFLFESTTTDMNDEKNEKYLDDLSKIGKLLKSLSTPFIEINEDILYSPPIRTNWYVDYEGDKLIELNNDQYFGFFMLTAILMEIDYNKTAGSSRSKILPKLKKSKHPLMTHLKYILSARYKTVSLESIKIGFEKCNFNEEQQTFILSWINSEINLVRNEVIPEL